MFTSRPSSGNAGVLDERRSALRFGLRPVLACITVAGATFLAQRWIASHLLPLLGVTVGLLQDDFTVHLQLLGEGVHTAIQATPFLLRPIPLAGDLALRPFVSLAPLTVNVDHALVPLVLLISGLASWPLAGWREAIVRAVFALVALLVVLVLTTPVLLVGMQQAAFVEAAQHHGGNPHEPALFTLMIFMESGGRWLLPLAFALACVTGSMRICSKRVRPIPVNVPAPAVEAARMVFPPVQVREQESASYALSLNP